MKPDTKKAKPEKVEVCTCGHSIDEHKGGVCTKCDCTVFVPDNDE